MTDTVAAPPVNPVVALLGGVAAGLIAGLFGVGGGVLLVPFLGLTMGAGSLAGGWVGAHVALGLPPSTLARLFGVLLVITAFLMLRKAKEPA